MAVLSLSYAELAKRLGVSIDGARMKAKRARWPKVKGNDGTMRVSVEEAELTPTERSPNVRPAFAEQPNEHVVEHIRTLEAYVATLKDQLAKAEALASDHGREVAVERERVADLTAQLLRLTTELLDARKPAEPAPRRSWWQRLTG